MILSLLVATMLPRLEGRIQRYLVAGIIASVFSSISVIDLYLSNLSYPFLGSVFSLISSDGPAQQSLCVQLRIGSPYTTVYSSCDGSPVGFIILTVGTLLSVNLTGFLLGSEIRARLTKPLGVRTLSLYSVPIVGSVLATLATGLLAQSVLSAPGAGTTTWYGFPLYWRSELVGSQFGCSTPCANTLWFYFILDTLFFMTLGVALLTGLLFFWIRQRHPSKNSRL